MTGTVTGFPARGRSINGWNYFEHKITGQTSITLSGAGNLDEVRLYPSDAQMTTYAYEPQIGITSVCDVNNRITYYEYDGLQRLTLLRDQDRNIIKKIQYKHADPVVFYNAQASGGFQRNNCTGCLVGSHVTYYVDDSTFTSTIDQEAANQLAVNAVAANGQAYANANGTCTTPPSTSINGNNGVNLTFTINCRNVCTNTQYNFSLPYASNYAVGSLPAGIYDVTFSAPGGTGTYTYKLNGIWLTNHTGPGTIRADLSGTNQVIITP